MVHYCPRRIDLCIYWERLSYNEYGPNCHTHHSILLSHFLECFCCICYREIFVYFCSYQSLKEVKSLNKHKIDTKQNSNTSCQSQNKVVKNIIDNVHSSYTSLFKKIPDISIRKILYLSILFVIC